MTLTEPDFSKMTTREILEWTYKNKGQVGIEMELIGVEKQEWESTLRISMERLAEIERLNNGIKNLAKLVLKLSPERKEWLEKHYGEYL